MADGDWPSGEMPPVGTETEPDHHDMSCPDRACDPTSDAGWEGRTLEAHVVVGLATRPSSPGSRRLVIRCRRITGDVDLRWQELTRPLTLERCRIEGDILLVDAKAQELTLVDSVVTGELNAVRIDVGGCLTIQHSELLRGLLLTGAHVGGDLRCRGSKMHARRPGEPAIDARGVQVSGDLDLSRRLQASAAVWLNAAQVGRDLCCDGSQFHDDAHAAVDACAISVKGDVSLGIARDDQQRLILDGCGDPLRCRAEGGVLLRGATVGGSVNCSGAHLSRPGKTALNADALQKVGGDINLGVATDVEGTVVRDSRRQPLRFEADGEVRLVVAKVSGQIMALGGRFHNKHGDALSLDGTSAADVILETARDAAGAIILDADGHPLRFDAVGAIRLLGVEVVGQLRFCGALLMNGNEVALNLTGAKVGERVFLCEMASKGLTVPFEATGEVRLRSTACGAMRCVGAHFSNAGDAFSASQMKASHFEWKRVQADGVVDLRNASVGLLDDDSASWSGLIRIGGFSYTLAGPVAASKDGGELSLAQRKKWLASQERYLSQPYRQLAAVYRSSGDDRSARKIAMEQFNEQLRRDDVQLKRRTKLWRWVLRATVGHGYEPWRAAYWAAGLWALGTVWVCLAVHAGVMVRTKAALPAETTMTAVGGEPARKVGPTNCRERSYPCLSPAFYSADLVFPIVKLDQRDNWRPSGPLQYRLMVPVLVALGWTLTTLVVAGFSSLVRRE